MKIWEHQIIYLDDAAAEVRSSCYAGAEVNSVALSESALDKLGDQAWDLASVIGCPQPNNPEHWVATAWFKRELATGADAPPLMFSALMMICCYISCSFRNRPIKDRVAR